MIKNITNVVFVCTGNTCRSPMAEGFANSIDPEGFNFISRGIYVCSGKPSYNAVCVMMDYGIDISAKKAAPITYEDVRNADIILTMTNAHKNMLVDNFGSLNKEIFTLPEFAMGFTKDVADPFGLDKEAYKQCALEIKTYVSEAIKKMQH